MSRLFNRNVLLRIASRPTKVSEPNFFGTVGDVVEIQGGSEKNQMHITASVSRNLGKDPNKCEIKVTNLSPHTRGFLDKLPLAITLLAGYDGEQRLLFTGDLRNSYTNYDDSSVNYITELRVADGGRAHAHARMSKSYKPPIRVDSVVTDCAKSMGLTLPPEAQQSIELKAALANGISVHGPTRDVLTRILAPYGFGWSVQNGALVILKDGQVRKGQVFDINVSTGLLGSPQRAVQEKPKGKIPVTFKCRLFPELSPGQEINLESKTVSGRFRLQDITHDLDSSDGPFESSCKAVPL